ncbi:hypothetical protein HanRHA438_Chr04g0174681 [Helianthus annuus]|nr:hypothetical protein HanRHA438_Chr04g0174681 [Helianthus annuus]
MHRNWSGSVKNKQNNWALWLVSKKGRLLMTGSTGFIILFLRDHMCKKKKKVDKKRNGSNGDLVKRFKQDQSVFLLQCNSYRHAI